LVSLNARPGHVAVLVIGWCRVRCRTFLEYGCRHGRQGVPVKDWLAPTTGCDHIDPVCSRGTEATPWTWEPVYGAGGSPASV